MGARDGLDRPRNDTRKKMGPKPSNRSSSSRHGKLLTVSAIWLWPPWTRPAMVTKSAKKNPRGRKNHWDRRVRSFRISISRFEGIAMKAVYEFTPEEEAHWAYLVDWSSEPVINEWGHVAWHANGYIVPE